MIRGTLTLSIVLLLVGLLGGVALVTELWFSHAPPSASALAASTPTVDGVVGAGEYAHALTDEATGITLSWSIAGSRVYFGLHGPQAGWLALGLDPDGPMMRGADILMGYVKDGQALVEDHFGDTPMSHRRDDQAGGSDDVLSFAGSQDEAGTTLEFVRLLDTTDEHDKPLRPGPTFVQLASAEQDDWTAYHGQARNTVQVDFFAEEGQP